MRTVVFSHGQESGPWGTKIRAMASLVRDLGWRADSIDYQGIENPADRVTKLETSYAMQQTTGDLVVLVGSSMGGHVAAAAASAVGASGLFVLAPAFYMPGYESLTPEPPAMPICIIHGWNDDIVPVENSIRYARQCRGELHILDGDHRLTGNVEAINVLLEQFLGQFAT